ncbi:hypothetical protein [Mycobacterium sp. IDR2000157661]|uniref:hypothetical protein n=1 Tax=Mycobacterium sp. IDR2000157661 TaxID=2867005 RepID=UPI001EEA9F60|nr:hypothetical protein [Mycobacterium sp. IDR2000157661]ULE33532.1 hypothetical protein K3G64_02110 [Mycobacterium sp. IDR2000157661]
MRKEGAEIMESHYAFTGVGNVVFAATAHPAFVAHAAANAAAVITPRKRRTAATASSVDRGTT